MAFPTPSLPILVETTRSSKIEAKPVPSAMLTWHKSGFEQLGGGTSLTSHVLWGLAHHALPQWPCVELMRGPLTQCHHLHALGPLPMDREGLP